MKWCLDARLGVKRPVKRARPTTSVNGDKAVRVEFLYDSTLGEGLNVPVIMSLDAYDANKVIVVAV